MSFLRFPILLFVSFASQAVFSQPVKWHQPSQKALSIRNVDFENFTYPLPKDLIDPTDGNKTFQLKNGNHLETRLADGTVNEMGISLVGKIKYGDVTGDGNEEAIIFMSILTGGTAMPGIIYVYTVQGNRPKMLWNLTTGDRAFGGYRNACTKRATCNRTVQP